MSDKSSSPQNWRLRTQAVRAGQRRFAQETSEAMFLTSGYAYDGPDQAAARFTGEDPGHIYSRFSNPTVEMFEDRLAALEGARFARATASGMAAVTATMLSQLSTGDHIVSARALFGSCRYVVDDLCSRFGIGLTLVDGTDLDQWRAAVQPETRVLFCETPSNPGLEIVDIAAVAEIAHEVDARLVVDNVFATPVLQRPLAFGADIVVYSATKHMDGQGRVLGGAILSNEETFVDEQLRPFLRNTGPTLSAFNAWVLVKSLETLPLRVEAMSAAAAELARQIEALGHPAINRVIYPHLDSHPAADLAREQMRLGGSVLTLDFAGDAGKAQQAAFSFLDALEIIDVSNNLGDAKSLATHNRTTTHHRLTEEERLAQGVTPGMVRLSIGLEDPLDLWEDIATGLDHVQKRQ